jgi:hypothetical protein
MKLILYFRQRFLSLPRSTVKVFKETSFNRCPPPARPCPPSEPSPRLPSAEDVARRRASAPSSSPPSIPTSGLHPIRRVCPSPSQPPHHLNPLCSIAAAASPSWQSCGICSSSPPPCRDLAPLLGAVVVLAAAAAAARNPTTITTGKRRRPQSRFNPGDGLRAEPIPATPSSPSRGCLRHLRRTAATVFHETRTSTSIPTAARVREGLQRPSFDQVSSR